MNKTTVRFIAGTIATAVLGLAALAAPAQADSAWGGTVSPKDTSTGRIIGAPAGGAATHRIIG